MRGSAGFQTTGESDELIRLMVDTEELFWTYMEENNEDCLSSIRGIVQGDYNENQMHRRRGSLYVSDNFDIMFNIENCIDCEWNWMGYHMWLHPFNMEYALEGKEVFIEVNREQYEDLSLSELYEELELELLQIKLDAVLYDRTRSQSFVDQFYRAQAKLNVLAEVISEKVNHWDLSDQERARLNKEREEISDKLFWEIIMEDTGISEIVTQKESNRRLIELKEIRQDSYCEGNYEDCGSRGMTCDSSLDLPHCVATEKPDYQEEWKECSEGEVKREHCPDGSIIASQRCISGFWRHMQECVEVQEYDCEQHCSSLELLPHCKGYWMNRGSHKVTDLGDCYCSYECFEEQPTKPIEEEVCPTIIGCLHNPETNEYAVHSGCGYEDHKKMGWVETELSPDNCQEPVETTTTTTPETDNTVTAQFTRTSQAISEEICETGCCLEEDPWEYCGGGNNWCDFETGECRQDEMTTTEAANCCEASDPWMYCGESECNFDTCECSDQQYDENIEHYDESFEDEYQEETHDEMRERLNREHPKTWEGDMDYIDTCMYNGCNQNEYCNEQMGWCQCEDGWFNNDGDWKNGCEATEWSPCVTDNDCAQPRCSEGNWGVEQWRCVKGESWEEYKGGFELHGGCSYSQSGRPDAWINFGGWGEAFEELQYKKEQIRAEKGADWCQREYDDRITKRLELQNSFNEEFMEWFFTDYIEKEPGDFDLHMRAIGSTFWQLVESNRQIAESMMCLHQDEWDERITPINIKYESPYGLIEITEDWLETDFFTEERFGEQEEITILTPNMKMWIFPPKEIFKEIIREEFARGQLGPEDEEMGPSPADKAEMRSNPEVMSTIRSIADQFGGDANLIINIHDQEESVVKIRIHINEDVLMDIEPALDYEGDVDATLNMDFDFFYTMVIEQEKQQRQFHLDKPEWDERPEPGRGFNEAAQGISMFFKIFTSILSGEISVDPPSALPTVIFTFGSMLGMAMGGGA